jgi:hypothetical protein
MQGRTEVVCCKYPETLEWNSLGPVTAVCTCVFESKSAMCTGTYWHSMDIAAFAGKLCCSRGNGSDETSLQTEDLRSADASRLLADVGPSQYFAVGRTA